MSDEAAPDERISLITRKANIFIVHLLDSGFRADEVALALASAIGQADAAFFADGSFAEPRESDVREHGEELRDTEGALRRKAVNEQGPIYVYMPPQNRWQRLRSKFMVHVWGTIKRFFMWRWHELRSMFEPRCEVHPNKRLHKGWCVACDVDAFIREQRLRNLRGE